MNTETRNKLKSIISEVLMEIKSAEKVSFKKEKTEDMKKSPLKGKNTKMTAASTKKITKAIPAKAKDEVKRPKKPSIPAQTKTDSIKESVKKTILQIIREEIQAAGITEMGRVAQSIGPDGVAHGVGSKFVVEDPQSATGYSLKGHPNFPDGTPAEKPKGAYVPKGIAGMGRPKAGGNEPVSTIDVKANGKSIGSFDIQGKLPSGRPDNTPMHKRFSQFVYRNPDMAAYGINPNVVAKVEELSDLYVDDKLTSANNVLDLKVINGELSV